MGMRSRHGLPWHAWSVPCTVPWALHATLPSPPPPGQVFGLLESDFNPLQLCKVVAPLLDQLAALNQPVTGAADMRCMLGGPAWGGQTGWGVPSPPKLAC